MKFAVAAILISLACTQPARAGSAGDDTLWSAATTGGTAALDNRGDQPFIGVSLSRDVGDGYVRLSATHIQSRSGRGLITNVPAKTDLITLSAGTSFGAASLDGYVSLGWRSFGAEAFRRQNGQSIEITSNGKTNSVGGSLTYDLTLAQHAIVSPFVSLDYSRVDTARAILLPVRGLVTQKEKQTGVTVTAGASAQRLFGTEDRHSIGLYAAFVSSSDTTAYSRGTSPIAAARLLGALDQPGLRDSWAEYGATASLALSRPVRMDLSVIRTIGFVGAESTSGSLGLSISF